MKMVLTVVLTLVLALSFMIACSTGDRPPTADELLSLGEQFLLDGNYEQALIQFLQAIEVEPMNPRGYTGAAEAYVGLGQYDRAREVLEVGLWFIGDDTGIRIMLEDIRRAEEERWQAEIEAEVERRLVEMDADEGVGQAGDGESEEDSGIAFVPSVDLAQRYLEILENIGTSTFQWGGTIEGIDSVSIIDITNDGLPELVFAMLTPSVISFYVYSDGQVSRIIYIEELKVNASNPFWDAYLTQDLGIIARGRNGNYAEGWSRILVFENYIEPAFEIRQTEVWGEYTDERDFVEVSRFYVNDASVTEAQFNEEINSIYGGAIYSLITPRDLMVEPRSSTIDISMTFEEAVEFLRNNPF